jgi:hypothetical protein
MYKEGQARDTALNSYKALRQENKVQRALNRYQSEQNKIQN